MSFYTEGHSNREKGSLVQGTDVGAGQRHFNLGSDSLRLCNLGTPFNAQFPHPLNVDDNSL